MKTFMDVYNLWPSKGEMAQDLGGSVRELIDLASERAIPEERYDSKILMRAVFMGVSLSKADLDAIRRRTAFEGTRKREIRDFYESAGGTDVVAKEVGTTPAALRTAQNRARLSKSLKFEMMRLASQIDYALDEALFEAV